MPPRMPPGHQDVSRPLDTERPALDLLERELRTIAGAHGGGYNPSQASLVEAQLRGAYAIVEAIDLLREELTRRDG